MFLILKVMNFLEVYSQKENHSEDENRLFNKIKKYDELLQKMVKISKTEKK